MYINFIRPSVYNNYIFNQYYSIEYTDIAICCYCHHFYSFVMHIVRAIDLPLSQ